MICEYALKVRRCTRRLVIEAGKQNGLTMSTAATWEIPVAGILRKINFLGF